MIRVYDFDNTIYDGESVMDFYLFLLKKRPQLIGVLPKMLYILLKYKMCLVTENELIENAEKYAKKYFPDFSGLSGAVCEFWDKHEHKIKSFFKKQISEDDIVLSAGFDFQLEEICKRLGIKTVISSKFNFETYKIEQICFGKNKLEIFRKMFPDTEIDEFYTDSMNDKAMFEISKKIFIVKGDRVKLYEI